MAVLHKNNARSTLAAGITNVATSFSVAAGQGALFPNPGAGEFFYATLVDASNNIEIVKVTARSTDTMTVVRAQDGTSARAYSLGDKFENRITAAALANKLDKDTGGTVSGDLTVAANLIVNGNATLGDAGADTVTVNASTGSAPNGFTATGSWSFATLQQNGVAVVTTSGSQTLTNKTLTTPTLTNPVFSSITNTGTITLPTATTTLVGRDTTDTLTNKTITALAVSSTIQDDIGGTAQIGYKDIPQVAISGATTLALDHRNKHLYATSSGYAVNIPLNATVAFGLGAAVEIVNDGSGSITVVPAGGVTLVWAGPGTTGTRTLARYGDARVLKVGTDTWFISGTGIS